MIWAEFVRDATPEEMKNAPGAATPAGHIAIKFNYILTRTRRKVKMTLRELTGQYSVFI